MRQPPPRDVSGEVVPHDHAEILEDHGILRRVSDQWVVTRADGRRTLTSLAFKPSSDRYQGMSVDLEDWLREDDQNPEQFVTSPKWVASIRFRAGDLRSEGFRVGWDPLERQGAFPANNYHAEVWGIERQHKDRLAELAEWFVPLPDVLIS